MSITKKEARERGREYRFSLSDNAYNEMSKAAQEQLITGVEWASIDSVHIYTAIIKNREVQTDILIDYLQQTQPNITTYLQNKEPSFPPTQFDVVIAPCLAVDANGNRVGYGGGGYDKFLANQKGSQIIALCFDEQLLDSIESESFDVPVTHIATEKRFSSSLRGSQPRS